MALRLNLRVLEELRAHAHESLPSEAVGLLAGDDDGHVTRLVRLPNLGGPRTFFADPNAQFHAERELKRAGLELVAIYYTHPGGCAHLSEEDAQFAGPWRCLHAVLALDGAGTEELRAYAIDGAAVLEVPVELEE